VHKHSHVQQVGMALIQIVKHCTEAMEPQKVYLEASTVQRVQMKLNHALRVSKLNSFKLSRFLTIFRFSLTVNYQFDLGWYCNGGETPTAVSTGYYSAYDNSTSQTSCGSLGNCLPYQAATACEDN
jgi:hypothetical protein